MCDDQVLDSSAVTVAERDAAVHLFAPKKIEKRMGFGTFVKPWEKPPVMPRGALSEYMVRVLHYVGSTVLADPPLNQFGLD